MFFDELGKGQSRYNKACRYWNLVKIKKCMDPSALLSNLATSLA